jgi:hypothetical protein
VPDAIRCHPGAWVVTATRQRPERAGPTRTSSGLLQTRTLRCPTPADRRCAQALCPIQGHIGRRRRPPSGVSAMTRRTSCRVPGFRQRVKAAIELLASEPRPSGAKKLVGGGGRMACPDWRLPDRLARSTTTCCSSLSLPSATAATSTNAGSQLAVLPPRGRMSRRVLHRRRGGDGRCHRGCPRWRDASAGVHAQRVEHGVPLGARFRVWKVHHLEVGGGLVRGGVPVVVVA